MNKGITVTISDKPFTQEERKRMHEFFDETSTPIARVARTNDYFYSIDFEQAVYPTKDQLALIERLQDQLPDLPLYIFGKIKVLDSSGCVFEELSFNGVELNKVEVKFLSNLTHSKEAFDRGVQQLFHYKAVNDFKLKHLVLADKTWYLGIDKDSFAQVYTSPADALNTHVQNLDKTTRNPNQMLTAAPVVNVSAFVSVKALTLL